MRSHVWEGDARVSQVFGVNRDLYERFGLKGHNGIDLALPVWSILASPDDGLVVESKYDEHGYGNYVKIVTDSGEYWVLAHMLTPAQVRTGDRVKRDDWLGYVGNTGNSTGPHLHLGWRPANSNRNNGYLGYENPVPRLLELYELSQEEEVTDQERAALKLLRDLSWGEQSIHDAVRKINRAAEIGDVLYSLGGELKTAPRLKTSRRIGVGANVEALASELSSLR